MRPKPLMPICLGAMADEEGLREEMGEKEDLRKCTKFDLQLDDGGRRSFARYVRSRGENNNDSPHYRTISLNGRTNLYVLCTVLSVGKCESKEPLFGNPSLADDRGPLFPRVRSYDEKTRLLEVT